jgi:hypothetical protein
MELREKLRTKPLPASYANIAFTIMAEALRRHGDPDGAKELLGLVSNPCLHGLSRHWFARKELAALV